MHFEQPPPRNWDHFEELCADVFQEEWRDAALVRNGRAGQAQHGIDIIGRHGAVWPIGVQCKKKSIWPVAKLTVRDLEKEVEQAKAFRPKLEQFYLVTTAVDDAPIIARAQALTQEHKKQGLFSVAVIGWSELVRRATRHSLVAQKHFGAHSQGKQAPLLASWRAANGKLLFSDEELAVSVDELIYDLIDFPDGRFVFRQQESEALLLDIATRNAKANQSLADRRKIVAVRDELHSHREKEKMIAQGLRLMFSHGYFRGVLRAVWDKTDVALLVRSFIEQRIDPKFGNVTGMEKIRLHPPMSAESAVCIFVSATQHGAINAHLRKLRKTYSGMGEFTARELPPAVRYGLALPAIIERIVTNLQNGMEFQVMDSRSWLEADSWKISL
nr:restriction endonuclease [Sphingopyxis italica]